MTKLLLFGLLDCFPLFLRFLNSLIKLILWLKFFHRQKQGGGGGGGVGEGSCPVSVYCVKLLRFFSLVIILISLYLMSLDLIA